MDVELDTSTALIDCQTPRRAPINLGTVLNGRLRPVLEEASPGASSDGQVDVCAWRRAVLAMADSMDGRSADDAISAISVHLQNSDELIRRWASDVIDEVKNRAAHGLMAISSAAEERSQTASPPRSEATNAGVSFLDTESRLVLEEVLAGLRAERHERATLTAAVDALSQRVDNANLGNCDQFQDATRTTAEVSNLSNPAALQSQVKALFSTSQALMAKVDALVADRPQSPMTPQDTDGATQPTKDAPMHIEPANNILCFGDVDIKEARALLQSLQKERDMVSAMAHGLKQEKMEIANMARWLQTVRQDAIAETRTLERQRTAMVEAAADLRAARDAATNAVLELQREHMLADRAARSLQEHLSVLNAAGTAAAAIAAAKAAANACEGTNVAENENNGQIRRRSTSVDISETPTGLTRTGSQVRSFAPNAAKNSAKVSPRRRESPEGHRTVERSGSGNLPIPVAIQRTVSSKPNNSTKDTAVNQRQGIGVKGKNYGIVPAAQRTGATTTR